MYIRQLPSGNHNVRVYDKSTGKYRSKTFPTKAAAKAWGKQAEFEVSQGIKEASKKPVVTLGEAIDIYIASKNNVLSPSTIAGYRVVRRNHLQSLMSIPVDDLTAHTIQSAVNEESRVKSPKTIKNACGLINSALKVARPGFTFDVTMPQEMKKEVTVPTDAQVKKLIADTRGTALGVAIMLAATAGLRRGEICALKRSDISGRVVTINKAAVLDSDNNRLVKSPKSAAGYRKVTIPQYVVDEINALDTGTDSVTGLSLTMLESRWKRKQKTLGITFRFHDLRHYNASIMLALGVPDKYAMARMGHSTSGMLKRVYQHIFEDKAAAVDQQMTDFFENME